MYAYTFNLQLYILSHKVLLWNKNIIQIQFQIFNVFSESIKFLNAMHIYV